MSILFCIVHGEALVKPDFDSTGMSINDVIVQLGYHRHQVDVFSNSEKSSSQILAVACKLFTNQVIFVCQRGGRCPSMAVVKDYIANYHPIRVSDIKPKLEDAIAAKSLTQEFLSEVLMLPSTASDSTVVSERLGYTLVFTERMLTDFFSTDGLSKWAKTLRDANPEFFQKYVKAARTKWPDDDLMTLHEVNEQANAWANIPQAGFNSHVPEFVRPDGTIDFCALKNKYYE